VAIPFDGAIGCLAFCGRLINLPLGAIDRVDGLSGANIEEIEERKEALSIQHSYYEPGPRGHCNLLLGPIRAEYFEIYGVLQGSPAYSPSTGHSLPPRLPRPIAAAPRLRRPRGGCHHSMQKD